MNSKNRTGARRSFLMDEGLAGRAIMERRGKFKTCIWRWQERFMQEGIDGLLHDAGRARYYGEWTDVDDSADVTFQEFSPITLFDVAVTYQLSDQISIRAGAENILDTYPDESRHQANRGLIYSRNAPYDTDGGKA